MVESVPIDLMAFFWGFFGLLGVVLTYKLSKLFIISKTHTRAALKLQIEDLQEQVTHQKKMAQQWRGRFGSLQTKPTIDGNPEDLETAIPQLIDKFSHLAPAWLQKTGLLKDEKMIKFLIGEAKKNPDAAKSFITQFIAQPASGQAKEEVPAEQTGGDWA